MHRMKTRAIGNRMRQIEGPELAHSVGIERSRFAGDPPAHGLHELAVTEQRHRRHRQRGQSIQGSLHAGHQLRIGGALAVADEADG